MTRCKATISSAMPALALKAGLSLRCGGRDLGDFPSDNARMRACARETSIPEVICRPTSSYERLSHSITPRWAQHRNFPWHWHLLSVLFGSHACHREQTTYRPEDGFSCLVFLAFSSMIFASISAVSENVRENPLIRGVFIYSSRDL
jgi:hypothetical protein